MSILEKIFKTRKDITYMLDLDMIEDLSQQAYVKRLAIDSCIEFVARAVAQSHFKVLEGNRIQKNDVYYKLNIKPNTDLSSDSFWQQVIYKLIYDNEVLIVVSDSKELLIADSFYREEYALYDDIFKDVTVKDYTYQRTFTMQEVIYLKYNNNKVTHFVESLFEDYGKIFGRMIGAQLKNYQIRGILKSASSAYDEKNIEKLQAFTNKLFNTFNKNQLAIAPLIEGFDYEELSNGGKNSNMPFSELSELMRDAIKNVALMIGIPPGLIYGETADLEKNTLVFEKFCLTPLLKKIQNELNAKLITQSMYLKDTRIEIVGVNKKDPLQYAEAIDKLVSSGSFTRNEVRIMLGEEPSDNPELDEYLITKNYEKANSGENDEKEKDENTLKGVMKMKAEIKGVIVSNEDKWVYEMLGMDSTCPKDVLTQLEFSDEDVDIIINSNGGNLVAGSEIYTHLRAHKGKVNVRITAIAASAASLIAMAGDHIEMSPVARMMIHNPSSIAQGEAKDLNHAAETLEHVGQIMAEAYAVRAGKNKQELVEMMARETWLNADEAIEQGFADSKMFENDNMQIVASNTQVLSKDVLNRVTALVSKTPEVNIDIDAIANKVIEKINMKEKESEIDVADSKVSANGFSRFLF